MPPPVQDSRTVKARNALFIEKLTDPKSPTFLNQTQAYKAVHPQANGSSTVKASQLMAKPELQEAFVLSMERHGLTDGNVNRVHSQILQEGEEGNRLKAARMYHELKGRLSNRRDQDGIRRSVNINLNIDATTPTDEKLSAIRDLLEG